MHAQIHSTQTHFICASTENTYPPRALWKKEGERERERDGEREREKEREKERRRERKRKGEREREREREKERERDVYTWVCIHQKIERAVVYIDI